MRELSQNELLEVSGGFRRNYRPIRKRRSCQCYCKSYTPSVPSEPSIPPTPIEPLRLLRGGRNL